MPVREERNRGKGIKKPSHFVRRFAWCPEQEQYNCLKRNTVLHFNFSEVQYRYIKREKNSICIYFLFNTLAPYQDKNHLSGEVLSYKIIISLANTSSELPSIKIPPQISPHFKKPYKYIGLTYYAFKWRIYRFKINFYSGLYSAIIQLDNIPYFFCIKWSSFLIRYYFKK